jgi:hypothetical protein
MRNFGARLSEEGFSFVPALAKPTYYVNSVGISTLDYLFFNPGIQVNRVEFHLAPKISHAAISTEISVPFPQKGINKFVLFV